MKLKICLFSCFLVFLFSISAGAQTEINTPEPFDNYVSSYKQRFKDIAEKYSKLQPSMDVLKRFSKDLSNLEGEFRKERREDYQTYRYRIQKTQSCTNGVSGKRKVCSGPKITCPPDTVLVGNESGVKGGGTYENGRTTNSLSWEVVKTGKGRNEGTATVHCTYDERYVSVKVEDELKRIKKLAGVE
ncbi:MAG: hypothetical protein WGN25_08235 [Candidatus Electrothrix sp. GW3-4]|uniref:hypothetical protein n=1 Tax=Candidatus Electrothrix sp. GW3-4 TaxID=3126740 RepID=UPI0030CC5090